MFGECWSICVRVIFVPTQSFDAQSSSTLWACSLTSMYLYARKSSSFLVRKKNKITWRDDFLTMKIELLRWKLFVITRLASTCPGSPCICIRKKQFHRKTAPFKSYYKYNVSHFNVHMMAMNLKCLIYHAFAGIDDLKMWNIRTL